MSWFSNKKIEDEKPVQELPRDREELLLGDTNLTFTLNDFVIHKKLAGLNEEFDRSLQQIFKKGDLDAENATLYDRVIDGAVTIALHDLNNQWNLRPEGIIKMVAWMARDVSELQEKETTHQKNIKQASDELEHYKSRLESLHIRPQKTILSMPRTEHLTMKTSNNFEQEGLR